MMENLFGVDVAKSWIDVVGPVGRKEDRRRGDGEPRENSDIEESRVGRMENANCSSSSTQ